MNSIDRNQRRHCFLPERPRSTGLSLSLGPTLALTLLLAGFSLLPPVPSIAHESSRAAVRELIYLRGRVLDGEGVGGAAKAITGPDTVDLRFGRTHLRLALESWQIFVILTAPDDEARAPSTLVLEGPRRFESLLTSAAPGSSLSIVGERGRQGNTLFVAALDVCPCPATEAAKP